MLDNQMRNVSQLMFWKAPIFRERDRSEPKLGNMAITLYMDVGWFTSIRTEEDKTVRPIYEHSGHKELLVHRTIVWQDVRGFSQKTLKIVNAV